MSKCSKCNHRVLRNSTALTCCICFQSFHAKCIDIESPILHSNWFCVGCSGDIFPFNEAIDDDHFLDNMNTFFDHDSVLLTQLNKLAFNPFEINDDKDILPLVDIDPDLNYFNSLTAYTSATKCNYYTENLFNRNINDKGQFSVLHLNIRSLPKHHTELTNYLDELRLNFTVIGLSETWLNEVQHDLYDIDNYKHIYKYRENRKGGGVSLFIRDTMPFKVLDDMSVFDDSLECLFVELDKSKSLGNSIVVGIVYRPPNTDLNEFNTKFTEILHKLEHSNKTIYVMGDFNINLLSADRHVPSAHFLDILYSSSFYPLITKPTRVHDNSATLIDNIFCNYHNINNLTNGIMFTDISDHFPIFTVNNLTKIDNSVKTVNRRSYNKLNSEKFKTEIQNFDWNQIYNFTDCQEAFSFFHKHFKSLYDKCFPIRKTKLSYVNKKPWLTLGLKNSIKVKNQLFMKYKRSKSDNSLIIYKTYQKRLTSLLRKAEKEHFHQLLDVNKTNLRKSWTIIKSIINKRASHSTNAKFVIENEIVTDKNIIATSFNKYFVNVGKNLAKCIPDNGIDPMSYMTDLNNNCNIFLRPTGSDELKRVVALLKNASAGWDDIHSSVLKSTISTYVEHLAYIINLSLTQGCFPNELKLARVLPLFKSGDTQCIKNYRPISVLPLFRKYLKE